MLRDEDGSSDSSSSLQYRVVVATENGVIKVVRIWDEEGGQKAELQYQWGNQMKTREIEGMCWGKHQEEVISARKDGIIEFLQINTGNITRRAMDTTKKGKFVGLNYLPGKGLFVCSADAGMFHHWSIEALEDPANGWEKALEPNDSVKLATPINTIRYEPGALRFAYGGKENDLKVWDIEAKKLAWGAKNVRNDFLDMRVPVWIKDIGFVPGATNKIVVATEYHQVRLYDTKAQRRPVLNVEIGQNPFTCLSVRPNGNSVVLTDTMGYITEVDLRKGNVIGGYRGSAGSMNHILFHPTLPIIASCGLDRYLRIHDSRTRSILHRLYLKQRLNAILLSAEEEVVEKKPAIKEKEEDEEVVDYKASSDEEDDDDEDEEEEGEEDEASSDEEDDDEDEEEDEDEDEEEDDEKSSKKELKKLKAQQQIMQSKKRKMAAGAKEKSGTMKRAKKEESATTSKTKSRSKNTNNTNNNNINGIKKVAASSSKKATSVGDKIRRLQQQRAHPKTK